MRKSLQYINLIKKMKDEMVISPLRDFQIETIELADSIEITAKQNDVTFVQYVDKSYIMDSDINHRLHQINWELNHQKKCYKNIKIGK